MEKFDMEKFDVDSIREELRESIEKPNILICGATGVGKSSLVNDILDLNADYAATIGQEGRPETRGIHKFTNAGSPANLFDSEGYEIGKVDQNDRYYTDIISYIDRLRNENPLKMEKHIHEVWYCISAANKRFFDIDKKIIREVRAKSVPVMILITKVDSVSKEELNQLKSAIRDQISDCNIYTYSVSREIVGIERKKYVQKEEILNWAINNLEESFQLGLIPMIKGSLKEKKNLILKTYVPQYAGMAAATVVGTSFVPVPFSDSVPLIAIQTKMAMGIFNAFGIKTGVKALAQDLLGSNILSYIGRTFATQLLSWLPMVGTAAKVTVNTSVATSLTAMTGVGITIIAEQYIVACVENGGAENLPFAEFLTKEKFKEIMNYVNENKSKFEIPKICSQIKRKYEK